ncbi:hypothetical protein [Nodosilinea sp. P-1105]|uniref:hypothetical protein n=1 Tax=Nodosilinea sp. P-1105 TaxID=2546229 RepID=UPI00146BF8FC|nr:hypothetical protein [Nodosilinea sp. P-1105]NMF85113.1 hypothetical protein [Nodosilinea sp. P-1105]
MHHLKTSPLLWSIGGVGLVALGLVAIAHLPQPQLGSEVSSGIDVTGPGATDPWQQAMDLGWQAAVAAQTAHTAEDWQQVGDLWLAAVVSLKAMPPEAENYPKAQEKMQEYLANFEAAEARKAEAPAAPTAVPLGREAVQRLFADGPMEFTFASARTQGPHQVVVGKSLDGLASLELVGPADTLTRATLALPQALTEQGVSMAGVVYAHHFLTVIMPGEVPGARVLADRLQTLEGAPQPTAIAVHGTQQVTFSTEPRTKTVLVSVEIPN